MDALPSLNKMLVLALARSNYVERRENIIAVGKSGTGKIFVRHRDDLNAKRGSNSRPAELQINSQAILSSRQEAPAPSTRGCS